MLSTAPALNKSESWIDFEEALNQSGVSLQDSCLMIVDASRYDNTEVLRTIYSLDQQPDWFWLFSETPFEEHKEAGPLVVRTDFNSVLAQQAVSTWGSDEALVLLALRQEKEHALTGIRNSLMVRFETYGPCFLRPYDSRFLEVLNACLPEEIGGLVSNGGVLIWSINNKNRVHWSSARGLVHEAKGLRANQSQSFERLLTWVSGWPRCLVVAAELKASQRLPLMIRELWSAGHSCPSSDHELETLLKSVEPDFHEQIEKDFVNVRR